MEAPQNQEEFGGNKSTSSNFLCRSSSARWTPTSEQIRILKEIYYNNGVRSPTAEQIQRISAKLRQYGKIEGKNVFYWFQNHKARERQKKRFSSSASEHVPINIPVHRSSSTTGVWNNFPSGFQSSSSSSNSSLVNAGPHHVLGNHGYASVAMEKSFRDCSISPSGDGSGFGSGQNFAWVGVDPYAASGGGCYPFLEKRKYVDYETLEEDEHEELEAAPEIETLPLFPVHAENTTANFKQETYNNLYNGWQYNAAPSRPEENNLGSSGRASLELTLNSYNGSLLN